MMTTQFSTTELTNTAEIDDAEIYLGEEPATHSGQVARYLHGNYNVRLSDATDMVLRCGIGIFLPNAMGFRKTVAYTGDCIACSNKLQ